MWRQLSIIKNSEDIINRLNIKLKGYDYDKSLFSGSSTWTIWNRASSGLEQLKKFNKFSKQEKNFNSHLSFFKNLKQFLTPF